MATDDDQMAKIRRAFADLRERVAYLERASGVFATEDEMSGPRADPTVRFAPNAWRGEDYKGKRFSECSPAFLEQLAAALHRMGMSPQAGKEQYASGNLIDARRARSWARRIRGELANQGAADGTAPTTGAGANGAAPPARVPGQRMGGGMPRRGRAAPAAAPPPAQTPPASPDVASLARPSVEEHAPDDADDDREHDDEAEDDFLAPKETSP